MKRSRHSQRGLSLVEALVSFAVAALGMTALVLTESGLRLNGDLARQRAEAVRLAHLELEHLRSFASVEELRRLAAQGPREADLSSNTRYAAEPQVSLGRAMLSADIRLHWQDRRGRPAGAQLHSIVAALDPALSGALMTRQPNPVAQLPQGRSLAVPPQAVDLGDGGRSAFTPPGAAGIRWIFDNRSGEVTSLCSTAPAAGSAVNTDQCLPTQGFVVSGHVRFSTGPGISPDDAEHPRSPALALDLQLSTQDGNATCFDDARPGAASVSFHCLVALAPGHRQWSGRLDVLPQGWTLGSEPTQYRVCRYSADQDGVDGISNAEHPLDYRSVGSALAHQNFLVIRGDQRCPADAQRRGAVNRNTVEQAPHPEATPRG